MSNPAQRKSANERVFQGELYRIINGILRDDANVLFHKVTQEEQVGVGNSRFADGKLYSSKDASKIVSFELKNTSWDATNEDLVKDAVTKAYSNGYEYCVTGTPRQLVIYKTFVPNTTIHERKLKIFPISNVKKDDEILLPIYEKEITPKIKIFLKELSDLVHNVKEVRWDSIDKFFVNKLSAYILEASANMFEPMYDNIAKSNKLKLKLRNYVKDQDIFNVSLNFSNKDIYNLCQLCNYLLYLKLIFYSYLQRDVPKLKLKPIAIPEDKKQLNKALRKHFDDVLKHDFELIFSESVLDEFEFEQKYIPVLKRNVEEIGKLNFTDLNADIIGSIYNTLIDNQEQHDRGQHFTNINEVDIVNAFCINETTQHILDSGCGAGTFLVRAYYFQKKFHPEYSHEEILERIWGIEIASFPAFLATMNLCLQSIQTLDNYPIIIQEDFSKVKSNSVHSLMYVNKSNIQKVKRLDARHSEVVIPVFDACVGNPPYIRQELIQNKNEWINLATVEHGLKKINQQSDLYVYYLMHTAAFLKDGGRLGYVVSSSWLDVGFGTGLQKFLLDNFKIIAIIDNQSIRSFETASINTAIVILEKCSIQKNRLNNVVKFVRIFQEYEILIGSRDNKNRIEDIITFVEKIENSSKNSITQNNQITLIKQSELEKISTFNNKFENGNWGARFLRSPMIYSKIIEKANDKLIRLDHIAEIKYGIKSGANDFFYVIDETEVAKALSEEQYKLTFGVSKQNHYQIWDKCGWYYSELSNRHYIIERFYTRPLFKTQKEALNLSVETSRLKYCVIYCQDTKSKLSKFKNKILVYIEDAEKNYETHLIQSVQGRENWYNLTKSASVGEFIFPSKIGEIYRLIDNRNASVFCDKVNYNIIINDEFKHCSDEFFIILNSFLFRFLVDLFSRQLTGSQTLSDVDVNVVEKTLILNPALLTPYLSKLNKSITSLKNREQKSIFLEVKMEDRLEIEKAIFDCLGLSENDMNELLNEAVKYVKNRSEKSKSLVTVKSKSSISLEDSFKLIHERFADIQTYSSLIKGLESKKIDISEWKAKYPKEGIGAENLFGIYNVYFSQGNKQVVLSFEHTEQLALFEFLNQQLEVKGVKIMIPKNKIDCNRILAILKNDYTKNISLISNLLKTHRSRANPLSIYRELVFR